MKVKIYFYFKLKLTLEFHVIKLEKVTLNLFLGN